MQREERAKHLFFFFLDPPTLVQVTGLDHVQPRDKEWEGKEETEGTVPEDGQRNLSVLNLERKVGVDTSGWGTVRVWEVGVQSSTRRLERSDGGSRELEHGSNNEYFNTGTDKTSGTVEWFSTLMITRKKRWKMFVRYLILFVRLLLVVRFLGAPIAACLMEVPRLQGVLVMVIV